MDVTNTAPTRKLAPWEKCREHGPAEPGVWACPTCLVELRQENERLRGIVPEVLERLNDQLCEENDRLRLALERIARWHGEFPETGKFWDEEKTRPTSYRTEYGSNGERDYMRQVARNALGA